MHNHNLLKFNFKAKVIKSMLKYILNSHREAIGWILLDSVQLQLAITCSLRKRCTKFRENKLKKACRFCSDLNILEGLAELPFSEQPVLETEEHALTECPKYHLLRSSLSENIKILILLKACNGNIMSSYHLPEFGKYRFPSSPKPYQDYFT